jgi:hypothetical protein
MGRDDIAKAIAAKLAREMPRNDLKDTSPEDLDAAMTYAATTHQNLPVVMGKIAAELHRRDPLNNSLRKIAARYELAPSTLRRWAKPFLDKDD